MASWYGCPDCEVTGTEPTCFVCGKSLIPSHKARPSITSGEVGRALTDDQWQTIRVREGVA